MTNDAVADAARRLAAAGVASARLDARLLWDHARNVEASALVARDEGRAVVLFESFVARRLAREPLAYIVGHKEFWSLDFAVGPGVLVPRPETETLIEQLCKSFPSRQAPLSILDLGTRSGCLLIAALREFPNARGVGVDASAEALAWARRNVTRLRVEDRATLIQSGWLEDASPGFDVVLCNPPYIRSSEIASLEPEVRLHEPPAALDGGPDGLDAYRALAPRLGRLMAPQGKAFAELGAAQADQACGILQTGQLNVARLVPDLAGIPRCIVLIRDNQDG